MRRVNVGVVGCGFIAESAHIPNLYSVAEAKLTALCDTSAERLAKVADKFDIARDACHTDLDEFLKRGDMEAVLICSSTASHAAIAVKAANAGKHIFVEKPMAENSTDADAMIDAVEKNGVKLMVGHFMGFLPTHQRARKMMREGALGEIFNFEIHAETIIIKPDEGILTDFSPHCLDLLRWYFDDQKVTRVFAVLSSVNNPAKKDTTATMIFELSSGITATISVHWVPEYRNWDTVERFVKILGTKGKLTVGYTTPDITVYKASTLLGRVKGPYTFIPSFVMHQSVPITQTSYRKELEDFINSIIQDRAPLVTGRDGRAVIKLMEAARRSSERKEFVGVDY